MKRSPIFIFLLTILLGCARLTEVQKLPVVPFPSNVETTEGSFLLNAQTQIAYHFENKEEGRIAYYLGEKLRASTGFPFQFVNIEDTKGNCISFNYIKDEQLGKEGYELTINPNNVMIEANGDAGFFYGVQTLLQILPPEIFSPTKVNGVNWSLPCLHIRDYPKYKWRGMHFDVVRHFFPKEFIKTYLDILAMHKINIFHWHLTDDQGWRIEIKKYPKLTSIGAWRVDREYQDWTHRDPPKPGEKAAYGGYYTQEDIKEIVEYAKERFITIVPEIEMPAHSLAALASYPQFSCTGGPFNVAVGSYWPITNIFCAGNDSTFIFLQNVLDEVIKLFPGRYIHVGGDEANKTEWEKCPKCQARIKSEHLKDEAELQSYFMKRIEKYLISKGKKLIGWDEILEGGLAPEATVMSWRGMNGGIEAARSGHDVVMTPTDYCYFDYYQGDPETEPPAIGGNLPLKKVYSFEPIPEDSLTEEQYKHILGGQANLWTEYVPTPSHAEYMLLPRLAALAEDVWTPSELKNYKSFLFRVNELVKKYEALGWNYCKTNLDD